MVTYALTPDHELLLLSKKGIKEAYDEFYNRHWQSLYNEAYRRLKNVEKCKDIVQDVFLQFWLRPEDQPVANISAFLKQAIRNQVLKTYRRDKSLVTFDFPLDLLADAVGDTESLYFEKELKMFINAWLELEPARRQEIFRMHYIDGYKTKDIADKLGISQKTVQKTLLIGIASLRVAMGKFTSLLPLFFVFHKS